MAVKIADAYVPIRMDTSQIDAQLSAIESRIAAIQGQARSATQAASSAASAMASAGGGGSGFGFMGEGNANAASALMGGGGGTPIHSLWDMTGGAVWDAVRNRSRPMENLGNMAGMVRDNVVSGINLSRKHGADVFGAAKEGLGAALSGGIVEGIVTGDGAVSDAMRASIDKAIKAGQDEAEIRSPSARAAREIGSPIMTGITTEISAGGASVANALTNSLDFAFQNTIDNMFGGQFGNAGSTTVSNPGGVWAGIPDYIEQFGNAVNQSFAIGNPQSGTQASRIFASNLPTQVRDFGQNLLSGVVSSILPGFASGPISDLIGTAIGTKPILTAEQALSPSVSADAGGLSDSPFSGGQFVFNSHFNGAGNFTDVERDVKLGIQESMRRLGVAY